VVPGETFELLRIKAILPSAFCKLNGDVIGSVATRCRRAGFRGRRLCDVALVVYNVSTTCFVNDGDTLALRDDLLPSIGSNDYRISGDVSGDRRDGCALDGDD